MAWFLSSFSTFLKGRLDIILAELGIRSKDIFLGTILDGKVFFESSGFFPMTPPPLLPKSISKVSQPGFLTTF